MMASRADDRTAEDLRQDLRAAEDLADYADAGYFWSIHSASSSRFPIWTSSSRHLRIITSHRLMQLQKICLLKYRFAVDAVAEGAFVVAEEFPVVAEERAVVPEDAIVVAENDPGVAEDRAVVAEDVVVVAEDDPVVADDDLVAEYDPVVAEAQAGVAVDANRQNKTKKKNKKSTPNTRPSGLLAKIGPSRVFSQPVPPGLLGTSTLHSSLLATSGPSHGLSQPVSPGLLRTGDTVDTNFLEPHKVTESAEEQWQRQLAKRKAIVFEIKGTPKYLHSTHCNSAARPRTPEPWDRTVSKRQWETMVMNWRTTLNALYGCPSRNKWVPRRAQNAVSGADASNRCQRSTGASKVLPVDD